MTHAADELSMIDWAAAIAVGSKVAGDGPEVSRQVADEAVAELRAGAVTSTPLVEQVTGLVAPPDTAPVLVVDRRGWITANTQSFAQVIEPIAQRLAKDKKVTPGIAHAVGSRVSGAQVGLLLGYMGTKVLGQFDPLHDPQGRLLLVAPNIVQAERQLEVDPSQFRLWVCLHEETHRVQFTAVPWMRGHIRSEMAGMVDTLDPSSVGEGGLQRILDALRSDKRSLLDVLTTPAQRELLDRVTGVMSLLEGHADVVMDEVGPSVIPDVAEIRTRFSTRRSGIGPLDRLLRRLMGMDAKMAQYRDGATFVRHVIERAGMDQFNAVWTSPETVPTKAEIHDPDAWMKRVLS